jgi:hypothetical protein
MAMIFEALVGESRIAFSPGLVAAHGGQVSPVNSSYKDMRGVCANMLSPVTINTTAGKFFFMAVNLVSN